MSKVIEFLLGSILITVFTIALMVFSALHYVLKTGGIIDCEWQGVARTWVDLNGDGLVNNDEPPLPDVAVHVDDVQNRLVDVGWPAITDNYGEVQLNAPMPKCSDTIFEIYVDLPEGSRITTIPRIEVNRSFWGSMIPQSVYYFGFVSEK